MTSSQGNRSNVADLSRREFVGAAAAVTAFTVVPRHVLGGQGAGDIANVASENIVALCDVDRRQAAETFKRHPNARQYADFRVMLEKEDKNIDAVVVATPDHTHAVASMMAIKTGKHGGVIFVGDKGRLTCGSYGTSPRLIPESRMKDYKRPEPSIARSVGHHKEWIDACKGGKPASSSFDYAGPLTEVILLGNIAVRMSLKAQAKGLRLAYDGPNMRITNLSEANEYLHRQYREGWRL